MSKSLTREFGDRYQKLKQRYKEAFRDNDVKEVRVKDLRDIADKGSSSASDLGRSVDELLSEISLPQDAKRVLREQYGIVQSHYSNFHLYTKEQVLSKSMELRGDPNLDIYLVTALMNRANKIVTGYELRPAQILSTLEFFREHGTANKFCQFNPGEGKTTLTSLIAVIKTLQGDTVDIITSNEVLAEDAVRERGDFYALFGLSVGNNNADHSYSSGVKACYKHDVLYGTIGNFEFDYLRHRIKLSDVKGSREFGALIIDEADNVVLDNATHIAKLSNPVLGMEYLKHIYLNIWQMLVKAELKYTGAEELSGTDIALIKAMVDNAKDDIKSNSLTPKFLESYIDRKLDTWIKNAVHARYDYHQNQHYIIAKKDTDGDGSEENVIPLDVGVGVTLQNTIWTDLHPFVQIKHNLQVKPDSLSSIFIANSEYIRLYKSVSGLTGTLGSQKEREVIKKLYNANSTIIPTYKAGMMRYETNKLVFDDQWIAEIAKDAIDHAIGQNRATLVICETVQEVLNLELVLSKNTQARVIKYQDEHDAHKIGAINKIGGIEPGTIVIATNIGGRGTDIKLSDTVKTNGGLHECTTFIASSSRILKQAAGRAARQGEPGSSVMIIRKSDLQKYNIKLDDNFSNSDIEILVDKINDERIGKIIPRIDDAERSGKYFAEFADLYTKNKQLGMNYFILEDLRLQWALAFDEKNDAKIRGVFDTLARAAENKDYKHQFFNPYFAIKYVDYILSKEVGAESYDKINHVLNQSCIFNEPELMNAASARHFELILSQWQRNKLEQLASGIIDGKGFDKEKVRTHLENVQQVLDQRIQYLQNIIDSQDFHHVVLLKKDLNNNGSNFMLKHIKSEHAMLQLQYHHINGLIKFINSASADLYISGKYHLGESLSEQLKIDDEELTQTKNLAEDSFYKLEELVAITNDPVTRSAITEVAGLFAKSALNFTFTESGPTSDDLIDSGIFDITKVILSHQPGQDLRPLSFGLQSITKSLEILRNVGKHVLESITGVTNESKVFQKLSAQIIDDTSVFSKKIESIKPKGILKTQQTLEGNDAPDHDINGISAYFGKYTLDATRSILNLRIKDASIADTKVVSDNYSFDTNSNNIDDLLFELTNSDAQIILAPLSLFNRHAVGLIFIKQQNTLYYIDPENQQIPSDLEKVLSNYKLRQLTVETQKYANCGPEVIENFMLCLTGKRLAQEEAIKYHSLLIERDLLDCTEAYDDLETSNYHIDPTVLVVPELGAYLDFTDELA